MAKIENKETEIAKKIDNETGEPLEFLTYADMLAMAVNAKDVQGFSIEEVRQRTLLLDKIEKAREDDSEGETYISIPKSLEPKLKKLVNDFKWNFIHADIVAFNDDVNEACTLKAKLKASSNKNEDED